MKNLAHSAYGVAVNLHSVADVRGVAARHDRDDRYAALAALPEHKPVARFESPRLIKRGGLACLP